MRTKMKKAGAGTVWLPNLTMTCTEMWVSAGTVNAGNLSLYSEITTGNAVLNVTSLHVDTLQIGGPDPVWASDASAETSISYSVGDTLYIDLYFSAPVAVTGTPQLRLATGINNRYAAYTSGSGTNMLTFAYIVAWNDNAADLDYAGTDSLLLNGGTIRDGFDIDIDPNLATPGQTHSLSANSNVIIDTCLYWDPAAIEGTPVWDANEADTFLALGQPDGAASCMGERGGRGIRRLRRYAGGGLYPGLCRSERAGSGRSITFTQSGYSLVGETEDDTLSVGTDGTTVEVDGSGAAATFACKLVDAAVAEGALTKNGEGTLILANEEEYTGDTIIDEGTLQLGDGAANGSLLGEIIDNATLKFAAAVDQIFGNDISGMGKVEIENDPDATLTLSGDLNYTGGTTLTSGHLEIPGWTIITTLAELQNIPAYSTNSYLLVNDLDATETASWNDGEGFLPIVWFRGSFDGGRHVVSHLTIDRRNLTTRGLFGGISNNALIARLGLESVSIDGEWLVGGLVGQNIASTISDCYVTGSITGHTIGYDGNPNNWGYVGGLVGGNRGTILRCHASVDVTGIADDGGLYGGCIGGCRRLQHCRLL